MSMLRAALWTEFVKSRRSRVPWFLGIGLSLIPVVGGMFMLILKNPEQARALGLLGAKAQLAAVSADWPGFLLFLAQGMGAGGLVLFSFLTAWVFGREFSDRTVRCILALPTPRWAIVTAKLLVVFGWCAVLAVWATALGFAVGALIGLPGWSGGLALDTAGRIALAVAAGAVLQTTTAFAAGVGRGYLPALGWVVAMMAVSQILLALGWAAWFPWAVPMLVVATGDPTVDPPTLVSAVVVVVGAVAGLAASIAWWQRADQTG
ncbi:MAG: ABC transporter permease [Candidatus Limnocylindrales bacterium]